MNTILLHPTDVLFFRDGRPMSGSLAGHGAAWPLPNVVNAAFHAALHRAGFGEDEVHKHRRGGRGVYAESAQRDRKFGSLVTAGPFPVRAGNPSELPKDQTWLFPRPLDLQGATLTPALYPVGPAIDGAPPRSNSLPDPLLYAVGNSLPPSKETGAKAWLGRAAFERYLKDGGGTTLRGEAVDDADFSNQEHSIGISIDADTGTTGQGDAADKIYSAHYLRLRDDWRLGVFAEARDKRNGSLGNERDLVRELINGDRNIIIVGGQQRVCTAAIQSGEIPLPRGKTDSFNHLSLDRFLVKWILLSPAVWPAIDADPERFITKHSGGWLPNWIHPQSGKVLLKSGDTSRRDGESREVWRTRVRAGEPIGARLVSAIVPKSIVVTGWALGDSTVGEPAGAQSTHLAVPAGAVYYFEAESKDHAKDLAAALNWHGDDPAGTTIRNRRSTLLGEKGFGLGVCGTWHFHDVPGHPKH